MPTPYYPPLSRLVDASAIPGDFQALEDLVQEGIDLILGKFFYKDLVTDVSADGVERHYSLTVLVKELKLPLFGSGMSIVFFKGSTAGFSEFPIIIDWRWEVYKYIARLEAEGFSYLPEAFLDVFLELADIEDRNAFYTEIFGVFFDDGSNTYQTFISQLITEIGTYDDGSDPGITTEISNIVTQLGIILAEVNDVLTSTNLFSLRYLYENFKDNAVLDAAVESIKLSVKTLDETYQVDIDFLWSFAKTALGNFSDIDEAFDKLAQLFKTWFDGITKQDFYDLMLPQFGIELKNINVALEFPRNWLVPALETPPGSLIYIEDPDINHLAALEFSVGTLKYSTVKGFEFDYDPIFDFGPAFIGKTGIMVGFEDLKIDFSKTYNIPEADADGRPSDFQGFYAKKATVSLPAKWFKDVDGTNAVLYGEDLLVGTGGISGKLGLKAVGGDNTLWAKLGASGGFELGFKSFDIKFKQNKVESSNIAGALKIKKFVYPVGHPSAGQQVKIDIKGHIHDDGDFNLTASVPTPGYPIELKDVFTYHIRSLELGKQDDDFYIGTSGKIEFMGFLKNTLKLGPIEIEKLRIYSDGTIEFEGGSIYLVEPIVLPLGPVEITVSAIHYGSIQKEVAGVMRKFNYFGFDGGISVDPLGIEVRGDGVKFYYCSDDLPSKPSPYLHIQTLYLDLTLPASSPAVIINGWLSIPEPGTSPEYAGGIKLQIPKAKISGSADMKLMPRYPAFIVDASIELPAPIPLGPVAIYGFRGLIGYRYVAEKEAVGLVSGVDSWYDYYKFPPRGIHVSKFNGPNKTKKSGTPFSLGAGASLGTSADNGTILNIKAMVLLSIPSLFMIDGRASVLSARLGLEDPKDPPFFAFIAIGDGSLELGFGADYKLPKSGDVFTLFAEVQAGFFFKDSKKWYVNFGTKTSPITAKVIRILTIKAFLMLSSKGIEAGARGDLSFNRSYGPIKVKAWAYIELGGKISFEKPQFGAFLAAGVGCDIDIKIFSLYVSIDILFGVEAPKPFLIYGEFRLCVKIKILFFKFKFCGNLSVMWEFNKDVDRAPIDPMVGLGSTPLGQRVAGVSMLSNETFPVLPLGDDFPATLDPAILSHIVPLDTYIDLKTEKGLVPNAVSNTIGGVTNPPERYLDMIPPEKIIRGKEVRQVKHKYSVTNVELRSWNPVAQIWEDYNPWKALYPTDTALNALRYGQFQKQDGMYNTVRMLATSPLSYTEQGLPGWYIPEQYGLTPGAIFCEGQQIVPHCEDFLDKPYGQRYYCPDDNNLFYTQEVAYLLMDHRPDGYAEVVREWNPFYVQQSLAIQNTHRLQIRLPQPAVDVRLLLSSHANSVKVHYYASLQNDDLLQVAYGNPDPSAANQSAPYTVTLSHNDLLSVVIYQHPEWRAITRIEVEPMTENAAQIAALIAQIASIQHTNNLIALGLDKGRYIDTEELESELAELQSKDCQMLGEPVEFKEKVCNIYGDMLKVLSCILGNPQGQSSGEGQAVQFGLEVPVMSQQNEQQFRCANSFLNIVYRFFEEYPDYPVSVHLASLVSQLELFLELGDPANLPEMYAIAQAIAQYVGEYGGCIPAKPKCTTLLHQVCWLSVEDYEYNLLIPGQAAIQEDTEATILGMTGYIQPIWRPATSYAVRLSLNDEVDNSANTPRFYTFGFTTAGPVGYFHTNPAVNYGDPAYPDLSPLTSLRQYIDYNRSYPNADGNLLNAKPLFYNSEVTRIDLYFQKAWARHFFHNWPAYNGQPAIAGRMKIVIKDPVEGAEIVNPPYLDYDPADTVYTSIPQTIESWQDDPNPVVPPIFQIYQNLLESQNCVVTGGDTIVPKSEFMQVVPKHLKPSKLYTALVNNLYDVDQDGDFSELNETREVHKFTFQTSRYADFEAQIMSYLLSHTDEDNITTTRPAIFSVKKALLPGEVAAAYATVVGSSDPIADAIETQYQHRFDRVIEGVYGLSPLEPAQTTEFNLIRDKNNGEKIVAVWIRNPEPFNHPRMPLSDVADTVTVLDAGGNPAPGYQVLFSKDYSQVLILHDSLEINGPWDIRFQYKRWNGSAYTVPATPEFSSDTVGTIVITGLDFSIY
jgi:hypothetical protein